MSIRMNQLNSLLSVSLVGFFALTGVFYTAEISAVTSFQLKSDGSKLIQDEDGSLVEVKADGTKIIQKKDGSTVHVNPNGTKFIKESDGTTIQIDVEGSKKITKPDGSTVEVQASEKKL